MLTDAEDIEISSAMGQPDGMASSKCLWAQSRHRKKKAHVRYNTKYNQSWEKLYDFVTRSSLSNEHIFCTVCMKDVSIAHQGACDIDRHARGQLHNKRMLALLDQVTGGCGLNHGQEFHQVGVEVILLLCMCSIIDSGCNMLAIPRFCCGRIKGCQGLRESGITKFLLFFFKLCLSPAMLANKRVPGI